MINTATKKLNIKPIISYPHQAELGKSYLMTIDLQPLTKFEEWPEPKTEEMVIYCLLNTYPLFENEPLGEPAVVIHRFGGTYGPVRYLLRASSLKQQGSIKITLVNGWGVPIDVIELDQIEVRQQKVGTDSIALPEVSVKYPVWSETELALQTENFEVATVEFEETFEFDIVTIVRKEPIKNPEQRKNLFDRFIKSVGNVFSRDVNGETARWEYHTDKGEASYFTEQLSIITDHSSVNSEQLDNSQISSKKANSNQKLIPLDLVYIQGGKFIMGTEDKEIERLTKKFGRDYFRYESPQHEVTVQPFYLSKYPITQRQWKAIALRTDLKVKEDLEPEPSYHKNNPQFFSFPATRGKLDFPYYGENPTYLDRPVEYVNWFQAKEFCDRLSRLTGKEYRLPTEAEWEYACRAGTKTPFYFGETITSDLANYDGKNIYADEPKGVYRDETTPVGMFPPNAFGLYDMHGNVWEWCEDDWHENYNDAPNDGIAWKTEDINYIVLRGGSFGVNPSSCRSACRGPIARVNIDFGFRVACVLPRTS